VVQAHDLAVHAIFSGEGGEGGASAAWENRVDAVLALTTVTSRVQVRLGTRARPSSILDMAFVAVGTAGRPLYAELRGQEHTDKERREADDARAKLIVYRRDFADAARDLIGPAID
jgi:hypothetical protein